MEMLIKKSERANSELSLPKINVARLLLSPTFNKDDDDKVTLNVQQDEVSSQIQYFCGYGSECSDENPLGRLRKAMENVEKYYAVVGVLEEMDKSLTVFEEYIPRYFKGIKSLVNKKSNANNPKPHLSDQARRILEKNLENEIFFYEFCRQRLYMQYRAVA